MTNPSQASKHKDPPPPTSKAQMKAETCYVGLREQRYSSRSPRPLLRPAFWRLHPAHFFQALKTQVSRIVIVFASANIRTMTILMEEMKLKISLEAVTMIMEIYWKTQFWQEWSADEVWPGLWIGNKGAALKEIQEYQ